MRLQGNLAADESARSEEGGGDEILRDDRERRCDVTQAESGPPYLRAIVGHPDDDTVPAAEYNLLSTTETGDTVESSAFLQQENISYKSIYVKIFHTNQYTDM